MNKVLLALVLALLSTTAFATGGVKQGDKTEYGNGPLQDHTCQGGHNCNTHGSETGGSTSSAEAAANANAAAVSSSTSGASASVESSNINVNQDFSSNTATGGNAAAYGGDAIAYGGEGGQGGQGGAGGYSSQQQGQSQNQFIEDSGNSTNYNAAYNDGNNSLQSTNINFEAAKTYKHTPDAVAPGMYSSNACAMGWGAGGSGPGYGLSLGGTRVDPQCQIRENARILAGLDSALAIMYLCANPGIDVGTVLGIACKPNMVEEPITVDPPKPEEPVVIITEKVKG
jgi:hypothetical protein